MEFEGNAQELLVKEILRDKRNAENRIEALELKLEDSAGNYEKRINQLKIELSECEDQLREADETFSRLLDHTDMYFSPVKELSDRVYLHFDSIGDNEPFFFVLIEAMGLHEKYNELREKKAEADRLANE